MTMRVLVAGASGQVGTEVMRHVPEGMEAIGLGSQELDIADEHAVDKVLAELEPQLIINAAAYTSVDKAEEEADVAYAINCDGVSNLARFGVPIIHISTDYVFAGDRAQALVENDPTHPTGVYGASKLAGERALIKSLPNHLILRTSWVFGSHGQNFVKTMLRLGAERDALSVVSDQMGSPTSAFSIAIALWDLARRYAEQGTLVWGVYHYSGAPACSWYDFALEIFRQANAQGLLSKLPQVTPIKSADYPTAARRPDWSVLDCSELKRVYSIDQADWRSELSEVLGELKML